MAQSQQFLEDFEQKMGRLAEIRRQLQASIQFKTQFTNELTGKLRGINDKVRQLAGLITQLRNTADDLQRQVGEHTTSIGDRERQIGEINQRIANTSAEKDRVTQEFNEHRDRTQADINDKQNRIEQMEEQLRQLTEQLRVANEQKENAENSLRALQAETQASGNQKDIQHAEAIRQLSEANERQLQEQQQQLTQRIEEADRRVTDLEQQLRQKTDEHQQTQQQLNDHQNQGQAQVAELQNQIDVLTRENEEIIRRLMAATQAINEANEELAAIVDSVPNAQTKQEVDALLNEITQQIELSIQNIGRAAQGQPAKGNIKPDTNITIRDIGSNNDVNMPFGQLIELVKNKVSQIKDENASKKYRDTLNQLRQINDVSQIQNILKQNGVSFKNNIIMGGRKTRKIRKQKGGFLYKSNTKRKKIKSSQIRNVSRRSSR